MHKLHVHKLTGVEDVRPQAVCPRRIAVEPSQQQKGKHTPLTCNLTRKQKKTKTGTQAEQVPRTDTRGTCASDLSHRHGNGHKQRKAAIHRSTLRVSSRHYHQDSQSPKDVASSAPTHTNQRNSTQHAHIPPPGCVF
jgi:hypothetical protein